jgi:hypothetical protein
VELAEAGLPIEEIVNRAVESAVVEEFHFPAIESPAGGGET